MEIESLHDYDGPGYFGLNEVHLTLKGQTRQNYLLILQTRNLYSANNKSKSFDHYKTYTLKYDDKLNLFYTSNEAVSGLIWNNDTNNLEHQITGVFPVIRAGNQKYCYIIDRWYSVGKDFQNGKTTLDNYCYRPKVKN